MVEVSSDKLAAGGLKRDSFANILDTWRRLMTPLKDKYERELFLSRNVYVFIATTALLARVIGMLILRSWEFSDEWQFGQEIGYIGRSLADGQGFSLLAIPTAKFPPIYSLLIGGAFTIFGVYSKVAAVTLFLFQSICAAITAVCLVVIGNHFFGRKEGIIAGLMWILYPSSIFHSAVAIWYSELSVTLIFLLIIVAISIERYPFPRRVAYFGGLSGLLVLTDSTMAIYPALLLLWMLYVWKVKLWKRIRMAVIWGITAGLVVSPWAIRNWLVLGTPIILKSNFGLELFFGNNSHSSGGGIDKERKLALAALNQKEHTYYNRLQPEHVYYSYLKNKALEWIRMNPLIFLQLTAKRVWYFWGKFPSIGPDRWSGWSWFQLVWYAPLFLLALYGFWCSRDRLWNTVPLWLFLLVYPLPYYVTHVQLYRYRYPVEPFIILLAAVPLTVWFGRCWGLTSTRQ